MRISRRNKAQISGPLSPGAAAELKLTASPSQSRRRKQAPHPNFWCVGHFKTAVTRLNEGPTLCLALAALVRERAALEKQFAVGLRAFSKRWGGLIGRNKEDPHGSLRAAWMGLLIEAESQATVHLDAEQRLTAELAAGIVQWKVQTYPKSVVAGYRPTAAAAKKFKKAQAPWGKLERKVGSDKKKYHSACNVAQSLDDKVTAGKDTLSPEKIFKLRERLSAARAHQEVTRKVYTEDVLALESDLPRYRHAMIQEFQSCQHIELQRINFFKRSMRTYQAVLAIDENAGHARVAALVEGINAEDDLVRYATQQGVGMPLVLLQFTEAGEPDVTDLVEEPYTGLPNHGGALPDANDDQFSGSQSAQKKSQKSKSWRGKDKSGVRGDHGGRGTSFDEGYDNGTARHNGQFDHADDITSSAHSPGATQHVASSGSRMLRGEVRVDARESRPSDGTVDAEDDFEGDFDDEGGGGGAGGAGTIDVDDAMDDGEWDYMAVANQAAAAAGGGAYIPISVRALFDYDAEDPVEISFKAGEILLMVEDEDEQGWCTGRNTAGQEGLYPANYCEPIIAAP